MTPLGSSASQSVQTLVPMPVSVQVAALVTAHAPHACALGFMATSRVSACDELRIHTRVSTPALVQVGAVVRDHAPHWWVWLATVSFSQAAYISAPAASTHRMCFAFMGNSFICL
jgi:hypothetical protein